MSQQPRWLTVEQQRAWIALSATTIWLPAALDAQLQRDASMTYVEYQVLSWLTMRPGHRARMSDLATRCHRSLSHLSRVAARLEQRGWMYRTPDPDDGRVTVAVLTEQGRDQVAAAAPGHVEEVQRLVFDNLTAAQVRALPLIGERIAEAINPGTTLPDPGRD